MATQNFGFSCCRFNNAHHKREKKIDMVVAGDHRRLGPGLDTGGRRGQETLWVATETQERECECLFWRVCFICFQLFAKCQRPMRGFVFEGGLYIRGLGVSGYLEGMRNA